MTDTSGKLDEAFGGVMISKPENPILLESGVGLAGKIRSGGLTSRAIVEAHIERIRSVNPVLNAVVAERFEKALEESDRADERVKESAPEELPPYWGVPCTIKECFKLAGMPNTSGLVARKGVVAGENATTVERILGSGAIPVGVTNISELCMWMESNNKVYGRTNNPYDQGRIVGGSSGGEGAIIAAGGSPFGLGSDIGGSIRGPAFFNGIFGHKPTGGLVPGSGQFPIAENEALRYLTTGPLARRCADIWPLLKILAGPDGEDAGCRDFALGDPSEVKMKDLTVLDVEDNGSVRVSDCLKAAQRKCSDLLAERGAVVDRRKVDGLKHSLYIWSTMLSAAGGASFKELMGEGKAVNPFLHLLRWFFGRSPHTLPAIGLGILEYFPGLTPGGAKRFIRKGRELKERLIDLIGDNGVMLYPPYASPAPPHNKPLLPPFNWVYTAIMNVMEFPVTQVPLGLDDEGLPLGVQVVGIPGNDHVTVAVALELEEAFGGWRPPAVH